MAKISPSTFTSLLGTFAKVGLNAILCSKGMPADTSTLISELAGGIFTSFDFDLNDNPLQKFYKLVLNSLQESLKESGVSLKKDQLREIADKFCSINEMRYYQAQNPDSTDHLQECFTDCLQYIAVLTNDDLAKLDVDAILGSLFEKIQQGIERDEGLTILATYRTVTDVAKDVQEIKRMLASLDKVKESIPKFLTPIASFLPDSIIHREQEVENLSQKILSKSANRLLMITGIGGVGKSLLARAVCAALEDQFQHIAWLSYEGDLDNALLGLDLMVNNPDRANRLLQIYQFLKTTQESVLLVMDNVNELPSHQELEAQASFSPSVRVLMTSRLTKIQDVEAFPLDFLSPEESRDLFYKYYSEDAQRQHVDTVDKIIRSVSCHTLTIELIARSAEVEMLLIPELWTNLQNAGFAYSTAWLETSRAQDALTIVQHIGQLFRLSGIDETRQKIMRVFAILPHSVPIPAIIRDALPCDINDLAWLVSRGWLQKMGMAYAIHQMVQESVKLQIETSYEDCAGLVSFVCNKNYLPAAMVHTEAQPRLRLLDALITRFAPERSDADIANLLGWGANGHQAMGDYPKALELHQKALAVREKALGPDHPSTATSYNNLGYVYRSMGDYPRALELYQKALAVCEKALGPDHPDTATSYNNLGGVYDSMGDYPKALEYHQKALAIREKVLGPDHPSTATSYNNLAGVYDSMGDYPRALELYQKALAVREKALGPDHPSTATSYNNLAGVYDSMGDYKSALDLFLHSYRVLLKRLGRLHPTTLRIKANLEVVFIIVKPSDQPFEKWLEEQAR